jgi:hypothetical protein
VELLGKVRDRSVGSAELLQNATPRGVRERGERSIKSGRHILNHMVQYFTASVRGMQGVAAKNDASYDLSSVRASVTGQTTIAASTAATPMTPPPSEKSGLAKDLIVILGLPALLLSAGAWHYWETIFPVYRAPSEDAVFDVATGVWDWQSHEGFAHRASRRGALASSLGRAINIRFQRMRSLA